MGIRGATKKIKWSQSRYGRLRVWQQLNVSDMGTEARFFFANGSEWGKLKAGRPVCGSQTSVFPTHPYPAPLFISQPKKHAYVDWLDCKSSDP